MDPRFLASRDDLYNVQMEVKQLQVTQNSHAERLLRVEKRLAEDAALKSVWGNSPFPSTLSGTPQHGPVIPTNHVFDDFDEQGENLISSLHLAEDEPVRRGAASRANSVRFDESALQGSNWGQATRHSGEFVPIRPTSGFGMMERSLSHKSDGRHSSAGHSVHSLHSMASGRGSSLGLDTNFLVGAHDVDSPLDIPEPPPSLFVLGSVPAIVRCWLTENFAHNTLLYADVCSGAQRSTLEFSLVKELDLANEIQRGPDGISRLRLLVYLAEAIVSQSNSRSPTPTPQIPAMTVNFEVLGQDQPEITDSKSAIRIFIGTDALRAHSADLLFSQNVMTLYSNYRDKLTVPFVRPEDDSLFRFLATSNVLPEKPKLNASAPEFVLGYAKPSSTPGAPEETDSGIASNNNKIISDKAAANDSSKAFGESQGPLSPVCPPLSPDQQLSKPLVSSVHSESGAESEKPPRDMGDAVNISSQPICASGPAAGVSAGSSTNSKENTTTPVAPENARRDSSGIWGSWRQAGPANGGEGGGSQRPENGLSGYQPAGRSRMKVLKPTKSGASSGGGTSSSNLARAGTSYEPPPPPRTSGEHRRKSQGVLVGAGLSPSVTTENGSSIGTPSSSSLGSGSGSSAVRWEKRSVSNSSALTSAGRDVLAHKSGQGLNQATATTAPDSRNSPTMPRSVNPVGGASAFSWMTPSSKPKAPAAAVD